MSKKVVIGRPFERDEVDLFISALGYEGRASYAARALADGAGRRLAVAFDSVGRLSFEANRTFFREAGFQIHPYTHTLFLRQISELIDSLEASDDRAICARVDVSSMSRPMIAQVVVAMAETTTRRPLNVEFLYCPAVFQEPSLNPSPIVVSQPVIPELAGWSEAPERGVSAVVGLGFEYEQALGALEFLEPAASWAFVPKGFDDRYYLAVQRTNQDLLGGIPSAQRHEYKIQEPADCFRTLEGLIYGLTQDCRPVLIPFGPKIFALICMLVGQAYSPKVTVWRVSGEQEGELLDRRASGEIIRFPVCFEGNSF